MPIRRTQRQNLKLISDEERWKTNIIIIEGRQARSDSFLSVHFYNSTLEFLWMPKGFYSLSIRVHISYLIKNLERFKPFNCQLRFLSTVVWIRKRKIQRFGVSKWPKKQIHSVWRFIKMQIVVQTITTEVDGFLPTLS